MNKSKIELPEPSLEHLRRLTDDTGLFQHAKFTTPLRSEGYATDDNARALIVTTKYYARYRNDEALRLLDRYFAYVLHSHNSDGTFRNFMNFDRTWMPNEPTHDALGRTLWAFGELMAQPPTPTCIPVAKEHFEISAPLIEKQSLRGKAYSILGLAGYLARFPDAENMRGCMRIAADAIVKRYEQNAGPAWPWFEDVLTYDNAMLPCALFISAMTLKNKKHLEVALKTCEFLLTNTFTAEHAETAGKNYKINSANSAVSAVKSGHFSFVGCQGWFPRGGKKAQFDQQPIEAAGTALMLKTAYEATGDEKYLKLQRKAFDFFLGENDLEIPLYDETSKGCSDGLGAEGISANQGAESTLSFLLSLLIMRQNESQ
jgi:hypothetical protein